MLKKDRREFIKCSSLLLLGTVFHSSCFAGNEANAFTIRAELIKVLEQWQRNEKLSPEAYLGNKGVIGMGKVSLKACTENDFESGNTFLVEGLVIGKTEAAVLAQLATMLFRS